MTKRGFPISISRTFQESNKEAAQTRCVACICAAVALPLCGECERWLSGKPVAPQVDTPVALAPHHEGEPKPNQEEEAPVDVDVEEIMTEEEADRRLHEGVLRSFRAEAAILCHQLRHKPKNPYCDACRQAQLRLVRTFVGFVQKGRQPSGPALYRGPHGHTGRDGKMVSTAMLMRLFPLTSIHHYGLPIPFLISPQS